VRPHTVPRPRLALGDGAATRVGFFARTLTIAGPDIRTPYRRPCALSLAGGSPWAGTEPILAPTLPMNSALYFPHCSDRCSLYSCILVCPLPLLSAAAVALAKRPSRRWPAAPWLGLVLVLVLCCLCSALAVWGGTSPLTGPPHRVVSTVAQSTVVPHIQQEGVCAAPAQRHGWCCEHWALGFGFGFEVGFPIGSRIGFIIWGVGGAVYIYTCDIYI